MTSDNRFIETLQDTLKQREEHLLAPYATASTKATRRHRDSRLRFDYRPPFAVDADRILYSLAYARYIDKTQVFYLVENDHITHRVLHVQLVAKIARTIGRCLGLNEDLIEAIALGHDIGHPPFGHEGERFLSKLCHQHGIGAFFHNVQSIQFLDRVEQDGNGWNLTLQVLDGILCHDGEIHNQRLAPEPFGTFDHFDSQIQAKKKNDPSINLRPMTLEGCAMRMADTVSYIGRDIEDAIRLNLIRRDELPKKCVAVLGDTNGTIVYRLVTDLIANSLNKTAIAFSPDISDVLAELKQFNYQRIYLHPALKSQKQTIETLFSYLFEKYLYDIEKEETSSLIYTAFLDGLSDDYFQSHVPAEWVRDFISGMTDRYFLRQCPPEFHPKPLSL